MQGGIAEDRVDVFRVSVDLIDIPENTFERPDKETVDNLTESFSVHGQIHPIGVFEAVGEDGKPTGRYELVHGQHRLLAAKKVGWEKIEAKIIDPENADIGWLRVVENLFRRKMRPAAYLANMIAWKRDYEARYPETVHGTAGGLAKARNANVATKNGDGSDGGVHQNEPAKPFYKKVAGESGRAPRSIANDVTLGEKIGEDGLHILATIHELPRADIERIAAIEDPGQRRAAVNVAAAGYPVDEAIEAALTKDKETVGEGGENVKPKTDEELTDDEWLDRNCSEIRGRLKNTFCFDIHALLYRHINEARVKFADSARNKLNGILKRHKVQGGFFSIAHRMVHVTHPKHWMMCGPCGGSGVNGNLGQCDKCQGNGFKVMMDGIAR